MTVAMARASLAFVSAATAFSWIYGGFNGFTLALIVLLTVLLGLLRLNRKTLTMGDPITLPKPPGSRIGFPLETTVQAFVRNDDGSWTHEESGETYSSADLFDIARHMGAPVNLAPKDTHA